MKLCQVGSHRNVDASRKYLGLNDFQHISNSGLEDCLCAMKWCFCSSGLEFKQEAFALSPKEV